MIIYFSHVIARKHSWKAGNDQFFHSNLTLTLTLTLTSRYNLFCFNAVLITAQATPF